MFSEEKVQPTREVFRLVVKFIESEYESLEYFEIRDDLADVYKEFSTQDPELILGLSDAQDSGFISVDEKLLLFVVFRVAAIIGPYNLQEVRRAFIEQNLDLSVVIAQLDGILMESKLKTFLQNMVKKVHSHKKGAYNE